MNQRERFFRTVRHEPHDRPLFYAKFTPDAEARLMAHEGLADRSEIRAHFGMFDPAPAYLRPTGPAAPRDLSPWYEGVDRPEGSWFNRLGVLCIPTGHFHFHREVAPLRNAQSVADLEAFPFWDLSDHTDEAMERDVRAAREAGRVSFCALGDIYEAAWQMRGYEDFLADMILAPEMCEYLLDRMTAMWIDLARKAARAGVDLLTSGDDVASQQTLMFPIDMWRHFIKSRWEKVYAAAREEKPDIQVKYHSDGNIGAIVPELIDIGVTILNPVQPECMDVDRLKREYGRHLVFDGTIGTQTTLPFGTPAEVRSVVRERWRTVGADGALILAPTHVVEPEVPLENLLAFLEACRDPG